MSECYPCATLVGAVELGYDHERPIYKGKPKSPPSPSPSPQTSVSATKHDRWKDPPFVMSQEEHTQDIKPLRKQGWTLEEIGAHTGCHPGDDLELLVEGDFARVEADGASPLGTTIILRFRRSALRFGLAGQPASQPIPPRATP